MLFCCFSITSKILPVAKATYIEGTIAQDTIWTLVDSPFILSNTVTVYPTATLTIEPGVEVKFGGNFSLIIEGRLVANGTEERKILFTTNDPTHYTVWQTITFNVTQSSLFINCVIEYGTNAIILKNGYLKVQNSVLRYSSENGITVNEGSLTIQNCEVGSNGASAINIVGGTQISIENNLISSSGNGICIAGGNQVNVHSNIIRSNGNGLVLTGHLTGIVDIRQNEISSSRESGILLESDAYDNTAIVENHLTANKYGFSVSANTSTYITQNYVSSNNIGILYTGAGSHQVYFNDIYENQVGIDVDTTYAVTVNATYNYWGEKNGPKHASLNPYGEGNPVGGDGVKLFFSPFLTHPFTYNNNPPTAILWTDKTLVAPYQNITFVGTDSQDDGNIERYFFDFNDTADSSWITLSLFNHSYLSTGTYTASLIVKDDFGSGSAPAFTTVNVADLPTLEASLTLSNSTVAYNGETWVTVYVSNSIGPAANADVTLFSIRGGSFEAQSGSTDDNGYYRTRFTAPNGTAATDVRLIARASMNRYTDASDYKYLRVLPPLKVAIIPAQPTIRSEETTTLNIHVTNELEELISDVNLTLSCSNGTLSSNTGTTDANGSAMFTFTAPSTLEDINVTVTVTADKVEYADGQESRTVVRVQPKILSVEIIPDSNVTFSEAVLTIEVRVRYEATSIEGADITISATDGRFATTKGTTDNSGRVSLVFTAPQVTEISNVTLSAMATKAGYVGDERQLEISVNPRTLSIQVVPSIVKSGQTEIVTIHVRSDEDAKAVAGAYVALSYGYGSDMANITDSAGTCTFILSVPEIRSNQLNITVRVTKTGYQERQVNVALNVVAAEGGLTLITLLVIAIPVAVVALIVLLIKMKIIVVSLKEET